MEEIYDKNKTEYNLNFSKSNLIGQEQFKATYFYTSRDYISCYLHWKAIRLLISNRLTKEELTKCKTSEMNLFKKGGRYTDNIFARNNSFVMRLDTYIELIQFYLKNIGLDIQDKGEEDMF